MRERKVVANSTQGVENSAEHLEEESDGLDRN